MATKRAMCPFCNIKKISNRFFVVNPDAAVCYCPNCLKEMTPSQAIKTYGDAIEEMVRKADKTLFIGCDPASAYQEYADILEVDSTNVRAYLGRLLCMVYLSKVRKSYIGEVGILLDEEIDTYFHRVAEIPNLVSFLKRVNRVVDEYEIEVQKRLTFRSYFYDVECLELYLTHLNGILQFKTAVLNECNFIKKKYNNDDVDSLIALLESTIKEKTKVLNTQRHVTVDGKTHVFDTVNEIGEVTTREVKTELVDTKASRYRMATLDINNKKCRYIPDTVFKDYAKMIKTDKFSIVLSIICFALFAGSLVTSFFLHASTFFGFVIALVGAGVMLVSSIVSLVAHLSMKAQIKKRRTQIR